MNAWRAIVPVVLILSAGCLKLDETLTIREDGSAGLEVTYAISETAVAQMKAMMKVRDQMASLSGDSAAPQDRFADLFLNPVDEPIRREIKKYEKVGITLERLKVETRDNWRHVYLKLACRSLAEAAKADFFPQYGFNLSRDSQGNYVFVRASESAGGGGANLPDPETLKLMAPLLEGFNATLHVTVPGKITASTAHQKSLYTGIWNFSYDKDPGAIVALQNQQFKVAFEGKGVGGKAFNLPTITIRKPSAKAASGE